MVIPIDDSTTDQTVGKTAEEYSANLSVKAGLSAAYKGLITTFSAQIT